MGKIEWKRETDESHGKTKLSEEEAGLSSRSRSVCRAMNRKFLSKRRLVRFEGNWYVLQSLPPPMKGCV